jgi:septum formation topological specificity factor MinE
VGVSKSFFFKNILTAVKYIEIEPDGFPINFLEKSSRARIERNVNWFQPKQGGQQSIKSTGFVDHFTLEANRRDWHLRLLEENRQKVKKGKGRLHSFKLKIISKDVLYWFGLSVKNPRFLETTPAMLEIVFPCPSSASRLRAKAHANAIKKAVYHVVQLPSGEIEETQFIHFDFYLAPKNISMIDLIPQGPTEKPIVNNFSQINGRTEYRGCPVTLEGLKEKIWVVVSKYNGILADKVIIKTF